MSKFSTCCYIRENLGQKPPDWNVISEISGGCQEVPRGTPRTKFCKICAFFSKNFRIFVYRKSITSPEFRRKMGEKTSKKCTFFHFTFLGQRGTKKVANCIIFLLRKNFLRFFAIFLRFFAIFLRIESSPPEGFFEK